MPRRSPLFAFPNSSWCWGALAVATAGLLAGCGSNAAAPTTTTAAAPTTTAAATTTTAAATTTTTSTTLAPTTTAPVVVKTCVPAQLTVIAGQSGVAAGTGGRVFRLENSSSVPCTLFGYPGLALLDGSSKPLPTTVVRQPGVSETTVTLAPGASAYFSATWPDGTGYANLSCPTSAALEITPPNDTMPLVVSGSGGVIQAFGGTTSKLQCGTITVTPVRATATA